MVLKCMCFEFKYDVCFSSVSGMECVHLLDSLSQSKQYSYHLRPQSASSQSRIKD